MLCFVTNLCGFRSLRILGEVPQVLPDFAPPCLSKVLRDLSLVQLPLRDLLAVDFLHAQLNLRVILQGTARLQQQLVNLPVFKVL